MRCPRGPWTATLADPGQPPLRLPALPLRSLEVGLETGRAAAAVPMSYDREFTARRGAAGLPVRSDGGGRRRLTPAD
jgi:hypothetical protein